MSPSPGRGWGGTRFSDPLDIVAGFNPKVAWPGLTMLMVSTTGEQHAFYRLDEELAAGRGGACRKPCANPSSASARIASRRCARFCSWRAPAVRCARASPKIRCGSRARCAQALTTVTAGGAPVMSGRAAASLSWSMLRCCRRTLSAMCRRPALVAPIEFTLRLDDYAALGGHVDDVRPLADVLARARRAPQRVRRRRRVASGARRRERARAIAAALADGRRASARRPDRPHPRGVRRAARSRSPPTTRRGARFPTILDELCADLPLLRADPPARAASGAVARRMVGAVAPFAAERFLTPMAAVAGAVAEEILAGDDASGRRSPRLCQQWRRHRASSRARREFSHRHGRSRPTSQACLAARDTARDDGARARDLRLARPQLLAWHRRRRHRARRRRPQADAAATLDRQRRRSARPSRGLTRAGAVARSAERSRRTARHARRRRSAGRRDRRRRLRPASAKPSFGARAA